jgi:predicted nuclease of predicted toxin-antitoxin system
LSEDGHDVLAVSEFTSRSYDRELIEQAYDEQRILVTEDKYFGWLVFASHVQSAGVILTRFPGPARQTLATTISRVVAEYGEQLADAFVVVQPRQIRISHRSL